MVGPDCFLHVIILACLLMVVIGDECPYKECRCFEFEIECGNLNLKALPTLTVTEVSWEPFLSLGENAITNVTTGGFPSGLGGIDFEGNPITWIDQDAFTGSEQTLADLRFSGVNLDEFPFAFLYLDNLQHLSILNSQILHWDISILIHLADSLVSLVLVDVGLTSWPTWIPSMIHLSVLEFSSAQVSIPSGAFDKLSQVLSDITLRNITMTSTRNIFSNLVTLRNLILDNNLISELTGLPNFGNLSAINLNNNSITDTVNLSDALRPVAQSLGIIFLNLNKLTILPDLSFMTNLESLFITDNKIANTRLGSVPANLISMSLQNNKITSISNFLRNALKLQTVNLSTNYITQILGVDIASSVTEIDFTSNLISEISDSSFPQNSSMITLRLDNNPLALISSSAFSNLKQLAYLSIQGCKLTRLPVSLGLLNSLIALNLSRNARLICTCAEKSLHLWAMSVSAEIYGDCEGASIHNFLTSLAIGCSK